MLIKFKNTMPGFHRNIYFSAAHYDILRLLNINHLKSFSRTPAVVYYGATSALLGPSSKSKKNPPRKTKWKWNFLTLILKNFLYFLIFQETETPFPSPHRFPPQKILIFHETETLKKLLIFPEMKPYTFQPKLENASYCRKCKPKRISYSFSKKAVLIFWETETPKSFVIFQETELSYISGNF